MMSGAGAVADGASVIDEDEAYSTLFSADHAADDDAADVEVEAMETLSMMMPPCAVEVMDGLAAVYDRVGSENDAEAVVDGIELVRTLLRPATGYWVAG